MIKITDYMTKPVVTIKATETIRGAVKKMDHYNIGSLIVVDALKKPVGIMTERDIIRKALAANLDLEKTSITKIMTKKVMTVRMDGTLIEVASIMKAHTMRRIVVVDKSGKAVGVVTSKDLVDILCT